MPFERLENIVITNAAGMVKTLADAEALLRSAVTRITVGSITRLPRSGNEGDIYYFDPHTQTAWNSLGMPNMGAQATYDWIKDFYPRARDAGKQLVVNVAGFNPDEYAFLVAKFRSVCDHVELNGGCPNVWAADQQKPIISYHTELLTEVFETVFRESNSDAKTSFKVSPVDDFTLERIAPCLDAFAGNICEVVATNTKPNQSGTREDGKPALAFRESQDAATKNAGGMSGAGLREDSLRVVRYFCSRLNPKIRVVGCGGIFTGAHANEYLQEDVAGFAVGTAFFEGGPRVFSNILQELAEL